MRRDEMIEQLALYTGIDKKTLENMNDEELRDVYDERILRRGML